MLRNERWDIHQNGHCFHPLGLDAYIDTLQVNGLARRVVGPYSRRVEAGCHAIESMEQIIRNLIVQLEKDWIEASQYVLFGVLSEEPAERRSKVRILDSEFAFRANPTMRTALCRDLPKQQRLKMLNLEWELDYSSDVAKHRSGYEFQYSSTGDSLIACCTGLPDLGNVADRPLVEILAEQGYGVLVGFCPTRLFKKFEFLELDKVVDSYL